ncbi:prolyl oligopeptidase family serine peptidase [Priestia megaterium]|uniref:prolyl oligopeptidase family serine peptidase n=1 Tax=Priestia megaterium TaxID=1404 RepID=UPI00234F487E|nr:prolyl oligopeptidase family serine peptidase [Priestia megaterium]MDC7772062.1 prolyl oligopeptidase family serine peptidase [Priestia megaterium]
MYQRLKKSVLFAITLSLAIGIVLSYEKAALAKQTHEKATSYRTVTEIYDWGAAITKIIIDLGEPVPTNSLTKETFKVHVARSDSRLEPSLLEQGDRTVKKAYVSDKDGQPAVHTGKYAVLEMEVGPAVSLGAPLNYDEYSTGLNAWIDSQYTITQQKDMVTNKGKLSGLVVKKFAGEKKELVDDFTIKKGIYQNIELAYASHAPAKDKKKNPLIIWLHGGGEGGTDATIPLSANKAVSFITKETQAYFEGAYVLVPQAPTKWMDGYTGKADGTSIYKESLMALIEEYVSKNPDIDPNRIYIGGASNGGYMTMLMIRDYPKYFAAAFPVCEGLNDRLITNQDIEKMKETPIWFVAAKNDTVLLPTINTLPTYKRLVKSHANNVYLSLFEDVHDTTGLYKNNDGSPYQYNGHSSWIYLYNNEPNAKINGSTTSIMEWMSKQSLKN